MTNPTSNYGFVLPTATDLVTDLPADFEVALQGVDTRLKALQPGTTLGDLAYSSATANTNTRLPIGTSGQVLAVSGGGVPAWTTTADVTPLTTKGDLFTFTTVDARIGVGANNTVLTADSAEATGLKWASPASAPPTNASNYVDTGGSTTSTSYTDLASAGPAVTITTGTRALVIIGCAARNTSAATGARMGFAVSGATTIAANDPNSYNVSEVDYDKSSFAAIVTGLTAGSNTFTAKYKVPAGTGQYNERNIIVIDMGS